MNNSRSYLYCEMKLVVVHNDKALHSTKFFSTGFQLYKIDLKKMFIFLSKNDDKTWVVSYLVGL